MDILLVGRHSGEIPECTIVEQLNVTFETNLGNCMHQIVQLVNQAVQSNCALVFQNTPTIVAVALAKMELQKLTTVKIGVIITKVGERPTSVTKVYHFSNESDMQGAINLIQMANKNAVLSIDNHAVKITVTPPMLFEFDRIEWLTNKE